MLEFEAIFRLWRVCCQQYVFSFYVQITFGHLPLEDVKDLSFDVGKVINVFLIPKFVMDLYIV